MNKNIVNCWNSIGVWGREKPRCPLLEDVIHCQNCEKYITAGRNALQRKLGHEDESSIAYSNEPNETVDNRELSTVMIIRIGDEWFALPSNLCEHVSEERPVHSIPHLNNQIIKGLVNISGENQLCFSLGSILGIKASEDTHTGNRRQLYNCLIVLMFNNKRYVFPVSEFRGLHKYQNSEITNVPSTVRANTASFLTGIISWDGLNIGCINTDVLFKKIERNIK